MRRSILLLFSSALLAPLLIRAQKSTLPKRLPDGRSRDLLILKDDHEKSLEDIREIRSLAEEVEKALEAQTAHVTSLESLRKAEKIESLAKNLQKRMKRMP